MNKIGSDLSSKKIALIVSMLMMAAFCLRIWDIDMRVLHHDESLHAYYSWVLYKGDGYIHNPMMHGPFQFFLTAGLFKIFGVSETILRLAPALVGSLLVGLPWLIRDKIGTWGTIACSFFLLTSPSFLYFSRFARNDAYMCLWYLAWVIAIWRYIDSGRNRYLYAIGALMGLAFATKETTFLTVGIFACYLILVSRKEILEVLMLRKRINTISRHCSILLVMGTLTLPQVGAAVGLLQGYMPLVLVNSEPTSGAIGMPAGSEALSQGVISNEILVAIAIVGLLSLLAIIFGTAWNKTVWWRIVAIFVGIWIFLFTGAFTNFFEGIGTGLWQALGYWLVQHDVARGDQPWFYYLMLLITYEFHIFVPLVFGIPYLLKHRSPFSNFLLFWFGGSVVFYFIAGEKMPWLVINMGLPSVMLLGVFINHLVINVNFRLVSPLTHVGWFLATACSLGGALFMLAQGNILAVLSLITIALVLTVWYCKRNNGYCFRNIALASFVLLGLVASTVSLRTNYVQANDPSELIAYTQSSADLNLVLGKTEEIAGLQGVPHENVDIFVDTTDGYAWPWVWYFRDFTKVFYGDAADISESILERDVIMLINSKNTKIVDDVLLNTQGYKWFDYRHREWHPESYRDFSTESLMDMKSWRNAINYLLFRELGSPTGSAEARMYFPIE